MIDKCTNHWPLSTMDPNHFGYAANGGEANSLSMYCIDTSVRTGHYRSQ